MDMFIYFGLVVVGFIGLVAGGELLVRSASAIAAAFRIPPIIVGLTVVAFGTSAPELAVVVGAAWKGETELAVGNAVGSNICNVLLILGVSALVAPLSVSKRLIRIDVPLMIAASLLLWFFSRDNSIGFSDGAVLFSALVIYLVWSAIEGKNSGSDEADEGGKAGARFITSQTILFVIGLALLSGGADLLVENSSKIALSLGVSPIIIGLTIVAIGTSLPEGVTSVVAAIRGERDIAVGNIVGSNLFNILCVLGVGGLIAPDGLNVPQSAIYFDIPVMVAIAIGCIPVFYSGHTITRFEGGILFAYYLAYLTYLVLHEVKPPVADSFAWFLICVAIPLTLIVFFVGLVSHIRAIYAAAQSQNSA